MDRFIKIGVCAFATLALLAQGLPASAASSRACDAFARDYARNASRQGQVVRQGSIGALLGLGIGAIAGHPGAGAAIGAGAGTISGGATRSRDYDHIYRAAYRDCMAGRVR